MFAGYYQLRRLFSTNVAACCSVLRSGSTTSTDSDDSPPTFHIGVPLLRLTINC